MECPICQQRMRHEKIESAWVDVCDNHGVWLDKGEIEAIMHAAKERGGGEAFVDGLWNSTHHY